MDLGMIGLGRMGAHMTERLIGGGHRVVGFDRKEEAIQRVVEKGAIGVSSLEELASKLPSPRVVWLMVPQGDPVDDALEGLLPHIKKDDIVVDGGNSHYKDSQRRADLLKRRGIYFLDVGVSGGIWGLKEGYSLMIGGAPEAVRRLIPIFETLAPSHNRGWGHVGPEGAGHFVKMVHNGIEYGLMQAYAEGFALLAKKEAFGLDLFQIAEIWRYGSVIRSWLLDLIEQTLKEDQRLEHVAPFVAESGEGRWTVEEALDLGLSLPVITQALFERFKSQDTEGFPYRLLAMMRSAFGGHPIKPKGGEAGEKR